MQGIIAAFWLAWPAILGTIFVKFSPNIIENFITKRIELANETQLARVKDGLDRETTLAVEKVKADLFSTYSTLQTSLNAVVAGQSAMRQETVAAVRKLWSSIMQLRSDFGGLVQLTMILLPSEIAEVVEGKGTEGANGYVHRYRDEKWVTERTLASTGIEIDEARLFCGDRLWLIFHVSRATYIRLAWQMVQSLKKRKYTDWRTDQFYLSNLRLAIDEKLIGDASSRQELGLTSLINRLENDFTHEAARVMSGSSAVAESLADMQAVVLMENERLMEFRQSKAEGDLSKFS